MTPADRHRKLAEKLYGAFQDARYRNGDPNKPIELLADFARQERLECAKEIEGPYPEDVFTPFSIDELAKLSMIFEHANQTVPNFSDRLHARWARHWAAALRSAKAEEEK